MKKCCDMGAFACTRHGQAYKRRKPNRRPQMPALQMSPHDSTGGWLHESVGIVPTVIVVTTEAYSGADQERSESEPQTCMLPSWPSHSRQPV